MIPIPIDKIVGKYHGRDWLTIQEWTQEELQEILDAANRIKKLQKKREPHDYLLRQTLFMIFFNRSLRTRNSFEAGMTQMGGHAHFLSPQDVYRPALPDDEEAYTSERISDVARVLARMGDAIAIRIYGSHAKWIYGRGHRILREFAKWSDIPVIDMECDTFHPCQAMADMQTIQENCSKVGGKRFVMSWAYSPSTQKPLAVPQSGVLMGTKWGMDVVLAHPKGFELDPKIISMCKENVSKYGGSFEVSNDMEAAFAGAHFVYPKCWTSKHYIPPIAPVEDWEGCQKLFDANKHWICDADKMALAAKDAKYMHCLPADRGFEVTDEVLDGDQSIAFDEAENRLHAQKAIMAAIMGRPSK